MAATPSDAATERKDTSIGIEVTPDGPYVVRGALPLSRRRIVLSEHGETTGWETTETLESAGTVWLCRCGQSRRKPFCDGSHAGSGFDGSERAPETSYDARATTYAGATVVVRDDRSVCAHAGFCGNRVTNVWKMAGAPADDDGGLRAEMLAMIDRCPSGALTYRLTPDGVDVELAGGPAIAVVADEPYVVAGGVPVARADGAPSETRQRVTLCRCGASQAKPLCDGSHAKHGFRDG